MAAAAADGGGMRRRMRGRGGRRRRGGRPVAAGRRAQPPSMRRGCRRSARALQSSARAWRSRRALEAARAGRGGRSNTPASRAAAPEVDDATNEGGRAAGWTLLRPPALSCPDASRVKAAAGACIRACAREQGHVCCGSCAGCVRRSGFGGAGDHRGLWCQCVGAAYTGVRFGAVPVFL